MKTGNTHHGSAGHRASHPPQWSPVMKTGNTTMSLITCHAALKSSMEPGHEDREYMTSRGM